MVKEIKTKPESNVPAWVKGEITKLRNRYTELEGCIDKYEKWFETEQIEYHRERMIYLIVAAILVAVLAYVIITL